jgi:hypothetical protein
LKIALNAVAGIKNLVGNNFPELIGAILIALGE